MATPDDTVVYRLVPEFPNYRVGTDGSVWSRSGQVRKPLAVDGEWRRLRPGGRRKGGYLSVTLCDGVTRRIWPVHRLVLSVFVGPCPKGMECCHTNGNRVDNRLANLRWDTRSENTKDRIRHGTWKPPASNGEGGRACRKLRPDQVRAIRTAHASGGRSAASLARDHGVISDLVERILRGQTYRSVV